MKSLLSSLALLACALAPARAADLPPEALELFRWFDTLGYPDISKAQWITTSWEPGMGGEPTVTGKKNGFLLRNDQGEVTFLTSDLFQTTVPKSTPEGTFIYAERPFMLAMQDLIAELRNSRDTSALDKIGSWHLSLKNRLFVLAYAAWKKGDSALAADLFALFLSQPPRYYNLDPIPDETPQAGLKRELATLATWQAILRIGPVWEGPAEQTLPSRPELLVRFKDIERKYPGNLEARQVREIIASLSHMIAEDKKHPKLTAEQIAKLPVDEQVSEWIFQLRDQLAVQEGQPGDSDVFYANSLPDAPAEHLLKLGDDAVPQLIETLSDNARFIRGVSYKRDFYFSHRPQTYADTARQILQRMADQSLPPLWDTSGGRDQIPGAKTRAAAEAWFKEKQSQQNNH